MKKLNLDVIMKILILLSFSAFYLKIIVTNEITLYVHPRIIPFTVFAMIVMIIISVFLLRDSLKSETKKFRFKKYIAFILPLIMIVVFHTLKYKSDVKNQDLRVNSTSMAPNNTQDINRNSNNQTDSSIYFDNSKTDLYGGQTKINGNGTISKNKLDISDGIIKIDSKNFVLSLDELIENCGKYDGTEIEITGFVYKDNNLNLESDQFIIARYMMVCCVADMQIAGLRCQYEHSDAYDTNTWVKIKGKIKNDTLKGQPDPLILVDEIDKSDNPDTSYVYPY